ncbi:MAG: sigma 54-interacting transcriptional regulator [Spirochaetales bacterium]|nr:sigma 54-interacting transcriptional regulator [Spirochaetales bacterium]
MQKQYESDTKNAKAVICGIIIICCFLCAFCLTFLFYIPLSIAENQKNDLLFRARHTLCGKQKISPYLIHVIIDDDILGSLQIPSRDRGIYSQIIEVIGASQAKVIACDIFFQFKETEENDRKLVEATKESGNVYYPVIVQPASEFDEVEIHQKQLQSEFDEVEIVKQIRQKLFWYHPGANKEKTHQAAGAVYLPFQSLSQAAKGLGHINCDPDHDGINRRFPLFYVYGDNYVPSLTLKAIADYCNVTPDMVEIAAGSHILLKGAGLPGRHKKDIRIPIDEKGNIIVNFAGPWSDSFTHIPVEKLLQPENHEADTTQLYDIMEDSLILLSNVSTGNKDFGASVFDTIYPLSGIHLNVLNMILTNNFIYETSFPGNILTGIIIALALWYFSGRKSSKYFFIRVCGIFILFILFHAAGFFFFSRLSWFSTSAMGIVFSLIALNTFFYLTEAKERAYFRGRLEKEREKKLYRNSLILSLTSAIRTPLKGISDNVQSLSEIKIVKQLFPFKETINGIKRNCEKMVILITELIDLTKYESGKMTDNREKKKEIAKKSTVESGHNMKVSNAPQYPRKIRILLVDDEECERKRIMEILNGSYTIMEAENGKKGIQIVESENPDLIITDLVMPVMKGNEFISYLRKNEETMQIPVILLSGLPEEEIGVEVDDYLSKQYTDKELIKSIENTLERANQRKELEAYRKQLVYARKNYGKTLTVSRTVYPDKPILIIDKNNDILKSYRTELESKGINNLRLISKSTGVHSFLLKNRTSLVILDIAMLDLSEENLLEWIKNRFPEVPVIITACMKEREKAMECIQWGAYDYLIKPVEIEKLTVHINHCIEIGLYREYLLHMSSKLKNPVINKSEAFSHIITQNEKMHSLFHYIEAVAESPKPFLIMGESGVGKELFAEAIHHVSGRKGEYVCENIGGLDDTMISDTLFGHIKGAFTNAEKERKGLLEKADGGTLFLDEIGDMPMKTQVKLLRILEKNEYRPLGSDTMKRVNVKIICATNRDISGMVQNGTFRHDLLRRFIHDITIPPLRERWDDLPLLVEHFIKKYGGKTKLFVPHELYSHLKIYDFPGNVRELETLVENAVQLNKGNMLSLLTFKEHIGKMSGREKKNREENFIEQESRITVKGRFPTLREVEELFIDKALKKASGIQTIASQLLGITPSSLSKKLKKIKRNQ